MVRTMSQTEADCTAPRRPFLLGASLEQKRAVLFRPRCKMWSCPFCAEQNKRLWAIRAYHGASELGARGIEVDFLTLTSHEALNGPQTQYVWPKSWSKLGQRARRKAMAFEYLLIPEQHLDGRLHVHAIETGAFGVRWWKDNARACGLGFMAEEQKLRSAGGAAWYTSKYLTKSIEWQHWPRGFRRVRASQGWPKLPDMESAPGWDWRTLTSVESLDEVVAKYEVAGYEIKILGSQEAWDYVDRDVPV